MISENIKEFASFFDSVIERLAPSAGEKIPVIDKAMRYSLLAGGKRLRPYLMATGFEAFSNTGWEDDALVPSFATAIEMIHTYSLIHDDLPALDDDDLRRGKETSHIVFGEDIAILAGDGLLNSAFELMSIAIEYAGASAGERKSIEQTVLRGVKAMAYIARSAGISGMIGGQVIDVKGQARDLSSLVSMYEKKTGALLSAALTGGAILGGASAADIRRIEEAALKTGVAFQIQDDILDVVGDESMIGKPVGSDEKRAQVTYVSLCGLDQAERDVEKLLAEAKDVLNETDGHCDRIAALIDSLSGRSY